MSPSPQSQIKSKMVTKKSETKSMVWVGVNGFDKIQSSPIRSFKDVSKVLNSQFNITPNLFIQGSRLVHINCKSGLMSSVDCWRWHHPLWIWVEYLFRNADGSSILWRLDIRLLPLFAMLAGHWLYVTGSDKDLPGQSTGGGSYRVVCYISFASAA